MHPPVHRSIRALLHRWRSVSFLFLFSWLAILPGCTSYLANRIVQTPNHGLPASSMTDTSQCMMSLLGIDRELRVEVGRPKASLAMWIIEPRDEQGNITSTSKGTVLVLHGLNDGAIWMLGKAKDFSSHGYRAVVVSLRGYGRSSGQYRSFGVFEKHDLSQVIDALQREQLCGDRVGVWGMSYGASMALELAGHDPRIKAVVAVAGFSSMREVLPGTGRLLLPVIGWFVTDAQWHEAIDLAGQRGHFNPDEASAKRAIARTDAKVLLAHGKLDLIVPYENAIRLRDAARPGQCELLTVDCATHITIWMDVQGIVKEAGLAWMDRWLAIPKSAPVTKLDLK